MQVGEIIHGFRVDRVRKLEEAGGSLWEMTFEKTGTPLCWLDRPDENKAFSIAFKTVPEDSTGVFHILEHSVLCGSDKYPVKEPFVELLKSSVQTFLNAMTYPDKTVYPVSSRNDQDLLNLMDVYLDAVLHPAIYHKPEIFRQEGWRYEQTEEGTTVYQGVVFNEMKGAMSSPEEVLESEMDLALFPDNCYGFNSGGDPAHIPDLTYEQFLEHHRKYYHPSNARISLAGSVNMEDALAKIESFLAPYDRQEACFDIPMQAPLAPETRRVAYQIGQDEPDEERTVISSGALLGTFADQGKNLSAHLISDYLAGDDTAPLKKAVLDAGLAQDFQVEIHTGAQQTWMGWEAWNTDEDKLPALRELIRNTLNEITEKGFDRDRLEACYNHFAFQMRDRDSSGLPRSLAEVLIMLDTWLYGGDPAEPLMAEEGLSLLRKNMDTDYLVQLTKEVLLREDRQRTVVLVPSKELGEQREAVEAERVAKECAAWSEAEKQEKQRQAETLAAWQQAPDSPEAVATIPVLRLSDLAGAPQPLPMTVGEYRGVTVLNHQTDSALARIRMNFRETDLKLEEISLLGMMCSLIGVMPTRKHDSAALQLAMKKKIGRFSLSAGIINGKDEESCAPMIGVTMTCLMEELDGALALVLEMLRETCFNDRKLFRDQLQQAAMDAQMSLTAAGHRYAGTRLGAFSTGAGAARENLGGITMAEFLKDASKKPDEELDGLLEQLQGLYERVFRTARLTISRSENIGDGILDRIIDALPAGEAAPEFVRYAPLGTRQEGWVIPAAVGFAGWGTSMKKHGREYHGSLAVLAGILNYEFLWNRIRVQGGAYGCGFVSRMDGDLAYYTYRDPQPAHSLDVMKECAGFIRGFCAEKPDLTKFIIGAISTADPLLNTESRITVAESRYFTGRTDEMIAELYQQLIRTKAEDLEALCPLLDEIIEDQQICVVAGQSQMNECAGRLQEIRNV